MVLAELGGQLSRALQKMNNATVLDQKAVKDCSNEIASALTGDDVTWDLVVRVSAGVKKTGINPDGLASGHNRRKMIEQAVFNELCALLEPGRPAYIPTKGRQCVVMLVGLQGSGKTTTCTKYAQYHKKRGWKPSIVCADTFRAGAFDQLKQNATKANIPFFGSYTETDPVTIAQQGVEKFKQEKSDLIIVDTSGRHKQEASLFEEMRQVSETLSPDLIIFVMDGSIGQAAFDQAQAFKQNVPVGAVIITKMDGHAKGRGALSAVAATKSPVIFLGTGEHMDEFEPFEVGSFVSCLLGMGDWSGLLNRMHDVVPADQSSDLLQKLTEGSLTLRLLHYLYQNTLRMGPLNQAILNFLIIFLVELDSANLKIFSEPSRIISIARGSGYMTKDVDELLQEFKRVSKRWNQMKGLIMSKKGDMSRNMNVPQLSRGLPPQTLW